MSILSPNKPQSSVQKAMDRMFEDFFDHARDWGLKRAHRPLTDFVPAIDMKESGDKVRIKAELPGMDEGDIKVEVEMPTGYNLEQTADLMAEVEKNRRESGK